MPSRYQQGGSPTYVATGLEGKYGEDPARFLECGQELAIARIRGIESVDLLREYARVEAERLARREVIGLINRRIQELQDDA